MATPKKKHLIELMIEAGVKWPEGAEYAAQDKRSKIVNFYSNGEPDDVGGGGEQWMANNCEYLEDEGVALPSLFRNWHQTIVTREQYAEAVADAEPWAAWMDTSHLDAQLNQVRESEDIPAVDAVEWHNPPSIEQLTAEYHTKAAEADRLQAVADEALKAADDALLALEKAGELIGLVISIDTKAKPVWQQIEPTQPEITDWRDLRIGDIVECVHGTVCAYEGKQGEVCEIDEDDSFNRIRVKFNKNQSHWCSVWRFIRRP